MLLKVMIYRYSSKLKVGQYFDEFQNYSY